MISWADVTAKLAGVKHASHVVYTVSGTAVTWDVGYPADIARELEKTGLFTWQPIDYPAATIQMKASYTKGVNELVRQILLRPTWVKFVLIGYSQGAIATSIVYDRIRNGDLQAYRDSLIGAVTFGNPRRQQGHTFPGGIDPGGHGIVTPNLVDTEELWWDFAAGKSMIGSPGQDLYTTCGAGINAQAVADQEAVWLIISEGKFFGKGTLSDKVLGILKDPLRNGVGATEAAINALDFFVAKGVTPHTSYQFIQPKAGDPRDCWRMALDYLTAVGAAHVARAA